MELTLPKKIYNFGFTLIELLVVVAIISLLATIVLASVNTARSKGRDAQRISDIRQLRTALQLYYEDHNQTYPTSLNSLKPTYISSISKDPLGTTPACSGDAGYIAGYYCYAYLPSSSPTTYHLGAQLENTSPVLNTDKDCNSGVANSCSAGAIYSGWPFNGTGLVYDITP